MRLRFLPALLLLPGLALGQSAPSSTPPAAASAPPLVSAQPPAPTGTPDTAATPAPPGGAPASATPYGAPAGTGVPSAPQASPFGTPAPITAPGPEVGLMVAESAMGMLTAAGSALLPYFLFQKVDMFGAGAGGDKTIPNLLTLLAVAGTPFAVASAEHGIAMQSRYFTVEQWPAQVAGIATQGAVIGVFYLLGGFGSSSYFAGAEMALLVGTVGIVPLAEMMALNLFKTPRHQVPFGGFGAVRYTPEGGLQVAAPTPQPLFSASRANALEGMMVPVASGRF